MLSRGTLTKEQLRRALEEQKQRGAGQIGEWLRHLGFARERDIAAALAMQWSCPLIQALPAVTHSFGLPIHLLQSCRIAPVHFSQATGTLHVAFAEQIAYPVLFSIEQMLEVRTEACLTTPRELDAALTRIQESKPREEKLFEHPSGLDEIVRIVSGYAAKLRAIEARVVGYGNYFWVRILGGAETVNLIFATERYAGRSAQEDQPLRPLSPTEKFA